MYPQPIFNIFGNEVYLYGLCIAVGLLACIWVLYFYTKKKGVPTYVQDFIFVVGVIAIAIGFLFAKLYQAFYDYLETGVFNFYDSGITVMGGLIGGAAAFFLCYFIGGKLVFKGKRQGAHIKYFNTLILTAPICIVIAHAFGRIGCLMSGCCHGAFLGEDFVFGGIKMSMNQGATWGYYVPTQLYESLFLFALFAVMTILYFKNCNILMQIYLIAYGIWRIIIEFFRTDYRGAFVAGLSPSQWQSIFFILGGIALLIIYIVLKKPMFLPKDTDKPQAVNEQE